MIEVNYEDMTDAFRDVMNDLLDGHDDLGEGPMRYILEAAFGDQVVYTIDYEATHKDLEYGPDWYPNKIDHMVRQGVLSRVFPKKESQ